MVVITSGSPRKPGMSRDDLLKTNQNIVASVTEEVVEHSPETILVVVANPLDAMCHVAMETSGFPRERVVGMAGILDTARYRTFIAEELEVSVRDVFALVLGGHGDTMVPLPSMATVGGVAITELLPQDRVEAIVDRTRQGGAEIVGLLQSGSAFYAPSAAAAEMVDAILLDQKRILPCAAYLQGEYGIDDLFVGVPVKLGASGIEDIIELALRDEELGDLNDSADAVRELVQVLHGRRLPVPRCWWRVGGTGAPSTSSPSRSGADGDGAHGLGLLLRRGIVAGPPLRRVLEAGSGTGEYELGIMAGWPRLSKIRRQLFRRQARPPTSSSERPS